MKPSRSSDSRSLRSCQRRRKGEGCWPSFDLSAHTANLPLTQKVALGVVVGTLAVILYWQFVLGAEWAARSEAQAELLRLRAQVEQTRQIAGRKPHLEQEIKLLEAQLQRTVQQLPTEKEIPALLKRVAGLGQETDLDVTLFKPGTPVAKEFYTEVPIQLKVTERTMTSGFSLSDLASWSGLSTSLTSPFVRQQKGGGLETPSRLSLAW